MRNSIRRHGRIFEINIPVFGRSVIVSDPALVRSVCSAGADELVNVQPNLSNLFGPGSVFALDGARHRDRRRLLMPAFRGQGLKDLEPVVVEETLREAANWPVGQAFRTLEPMNRISLNVILRTIFGADGPGLDELREIVPPYINLGSKLAFLPTPRFPVGRRSPWGRMVQFRTRFNRIVGDRIDHAESDPDIEDRTDILALLVKGMHDDATAMSKLDICDEVLTFIGAGHETTASALCWAFERLRRHPQVLAELVDEVDDGGSALRRATILEVLRTRTVIDVAGRRVGSAEFTLGGRRIPQDRTILIRIADLHENPEIFTDPERFDPYRFLDTKTPTGHWLAFGAGTRRCIGAEFATVEMDLVLRTVLQHFRIHTDAAPDEKSHFRGVAHVPKRGGLAVLHRRT